MYRYYVTTRDITGYVNGSIITATDLDDAISHVDNKMFTILNVEVLTNTDWVQANKRRENINKLADYLASRFMAGLMGQWPIYAEKILTFLENEGMNGNPS